MSKCKKLWNYVNRNCSGKLILSFDEIEEIVGVSIDHSFLNYKNELIEYGCCVKKISLKNKTILFERK